MGKPKFEPNEDRRETRSSKQVANLTSTLEQFTEAVKNKEEATNLVSDEETNPSLYQLVLSLKDDIKSLKEDVGAIHAKLDGHNKRINDLETFATNSKDITAKQAAFNTQVYKEIEYNEKFTKSRQAIFSSNCLNSQDSDFINKVKGLLIKIGASNAFTCAIDISRLAKVKNVAVLTFPTKSAKLSLYTTLKNWKQTPADQRDPPDDVYLNDFLTKKNLQIFKKLRILKASEKIYTVFSFNNIIYVKKDQNDDPISVHTINDVQKFM